MNKHVATYALIGMAGNRIGTGYIYNAEDYLKRRQFTLENGKPFRVRWRNEDCRKQTLAALCAREPRPGGEGEGMSEIDPHGDIPVHPVQVHRRAHERSRAPVVVTMRAYEVYCELHGPQPKMVEGDCRGGFGAGEIIAYLYARTFPKTEWRVRFEEALRGLNIVGPVS